MSWDSLKRADTQLVGTGSALLVVYGLVGNCTAVAVILTFTFALQEALCRIKLLVSVLVLEQLKQPYPIQCSLFITIFFIILK